MVGEGEREGGHIKKLQWTKAYVRGVVPDLLYHDSARANIFKGGKCEYDEREKAID